MKNAAKLVLTYPIAASLGYLSCALLVYAMLAASLSWMNGGHGSWIVPSVLVIYVLMTLLAQSTPLVLSVAAAF